MSQSVENAKRIEALRGLLDRLCAPDLTLSEAKAVRSGLSELLERPERVALEPSASHCVSLEPSEGLVASCV